MELAQVVGRPTLPYPQNRIGGALALTVVQQKQGHMESILGTMLSQVVGGFKATPGSRLSQRGGNWGAGHKAQETLALSVMVMMAVLLKEEQAQAPTQGRHRERRG